MTTIGNRTLLAVYLDELRLLVDEALARVLPPAAPPLIADAMRYALAGGGKRLRPCLALAVADAVAERAGLSVAEARLLALPSACALEMVHTYSLVHDDLPAMDDDDRRRGRPTSHVVYGDGLAILVGDGLLTDAFAIIAASPSGVPAGAPEPSAGDARQDFKRLSEIVGRLRAIQILAEAAGSAGMVGGQALDLAAAGRVRGRPAGSLDGPALEEMHARKTGALIRAAAVMGAVTAGADASATAAIDRYARELGLAFQIIDDVLDVEGSDAALGKTAGKDAASGKPTYPSLYGIEQSRRLAAACIERAKAALDAEGIEGRLGEIAEWSLGRRS
jgi:geranylgeranyl diphosphate synthase type II